MVQHLFKKKVKNKCIFICICKLFGIHLLYQNETIINFKKHNK